VYLSILCGCTKQEIGWPFMCDSLVIRHMSLIWRGFLDLDQIGQRPCLAPVGYYKGVLSSLCTCCYFSITPNCVKSAEGYLPHLLVILPPPSRSFLVATHTQNMVTLHYHRLVIYPTYLSPSPSSSLLMAKAIKGKYDDHS
jgi:hypothetical protein